MLTVGSLFSGIGGMELGLERAGMRCVWQVEIDPFCRRVLAKHWPDVRRHDDIKTFPPPTPEDWRCDLIAGGFPCQPVSSAGKRLAQADPRWLWPEFARVLRVLRPRLALLENVPGLLVRGFGDVLGTLADLGFDAEWGVLPATAFGALHIRARVFVVAHRQRGGRDGLHVGQQAGRVASDAGDGRADVSGGRAAAHSQKCYPSVLYPDRDSLWAIQEREAEGAGAWWLPQISGRFSGPRGPWRTEPDVGRVADGVPSRVDRIRGIGNAVVPQVAEWIGRRILEALA